MFAQDLYQNKENWFEIRNSLGNVMENDFPYLADILLFICIVISCGNLDNKI